MKLLPQYKTWIEIDSKAILHNIKTFRKVTKNTQLWAVVKSNAYGHGLITFSRIAEKKVDGFCVDSVIEGLRLRTNNIKKPILVLGPTLENLMAAAEKNDITISLSSKENIKKIKKYPRLNFHLKIDTGMHRQGFFLQDLNKIAKLIKKQRLQKSFTGIYTHFASAKDINYPTYTDKQFDEFRQAVKVFENHGFKKIIKHAAATAGALINPKYQLDFVRIGIGLYGLWPSQELKIQLSDKIKLKPVLSWRSLISEIKTLPANSFIGYNLTEKINKKTKIAIIPIGYWHGFSRSLSNGNGYVLIKGQEARILGKISMDLIIIEAPNNCRLGDQVTIIGQENRNCISADDLARKSNTINYEIITRINPLIKRCVY